MATDDINVFGSLRNFIADQSMRAVERDKQKLEAIRAAQEQFTPTPAQSAYLSAMFAPGSGFIDAAGQFPEFPSSDVELIDAFSGEPMPSIAENIRAGGIDRYVFAPLQALGAAGDVLYATSPFMANLPKGIATLGAVARAATKADKKGIKALRAEQIQQDINAFARDSEGFVSPSLEALISKAPPNLKGKQITEWLSANANKGVKPKELEFLGIDEFIANNPNASVREVAEGVSENKVDVGKNVYYHDQGYPTIKFEVTTPELDPLDPSYKNYQPLIDDIRYEVEQGDSYYTEQLIDAFNASNPQAGAMTISDVDNYLSARNESLDDLIDNFAKGQYYNDPYELVVPKSTGEIAADIPDETFAFGNEDVGYNLFIGGERRNDDLGIPYSRTEAQIRLRNALEEGGDPLVVRGEEAYFSETRYKDAVDESLPGGENYREIVYTWNNAPTEHKVSSHFEEPNQISHALVRDRKLADGSTSLHVDELQSDLHTQGKRYGYQGSENLEKTLEQINIKNEELIEEAKKIKQKYEEFIPKINSNPEDQLKLKRLLDNRFEDFMKAPPGEKLVFAGYIDDFDRNFFGPTYRNQFGHGKLTSESDKLNSLVANINSAVPNYPFKDDDWYKMSLKQLLKDAIEEGKDTLSVSGSAPMIARYSDKYEKFYKSLYDQKIPSEMKKLANTYGGKFEKVELDLQDIGRFDDDEAAGSVFIENIFLESPAYRKTELDPVDDYDETAELYNEFEKEYLESNIIRITPEMKQKILEEGLPSFALGGPVGNFIAPDDINIFA